jgi:ankyrin repeat protein
MCADSLLLHIAASENRTEICELLIAEMTPEDLCAGDVLGRNAMHYAAGNGNMRICELLFQKAPKSIYNRDCLGQTMLILAAKKGHQDVCLFFINLVDREYIEHREGVTEGYSLMDYVAVKGLTVLMIPVKRLWIFSKVYIGVMVLVLDMIIIQ